MMQSSVESEPVEIFTDGACSGNPGPGGWGVVLRQGELETELSGFEARTTNNRMELTAVVEALRKLDDTACKIVITTDSRYLKDGITTWIKTWKRNGWRTSSREPVKNRDLWEAIDSAARQHQIEWRWVRGHRGHPENERCDELARDAIRRVSSSRTARY
ncbi:MAG: ribonuclease HI [Desulfobacteraceae bacterium]|nr:ribonuclease HI [Desulfobacteraceae bacterium]